MVGKMNKYIKMNSKWIKMDAVDIFMCVDCRVALYRCGTSYYIPEGSCLGINLVVENYCVVEMTWRMSVSVKESLVVFVR